MQLRSFTLLSSQLSKFNEISSTISHHQRFLLPNQSPTLLQSLLHTIHNRFFSFSPSPDSDKFYEAIISNSGPDRSLETALDKLNLSPTNNLVADVLHRLRYDEKLAFRFFIWAGRQPNYVHEFNNFNFMIDVLSSTKYKSRQFGVVCDLLDYLKRRDTGSAVPPDALVSILKAYSETHLTHLRKFAKKKKIRLKVAPEIDAFNLLIDAFCKSSLVWEAEVLFHRMKGRIMPDANTYNILFFGWCRVREPKKAMKVLDEMIEKGLPPDNFTYNTAIDSFCSIGMVKEARELFEFMRTKGSTISSPTAKSYCIMVVALAKAEMMTECFNLLSDMMGSGCLPDVSTFKDLIEGMCLVGKVGEAYKILEEMSKKGYPPDILTYNCFLKVLCNLKKPEEALRLCERMIDAGCELSAHTYNMLMVMFFEMKEPNRAIDMWAEMDKRGCSRSVDSYSTMIEGLFSCGRVEDACSLLEEVIDLGLKLPYQKFDVLMIKLSEVGNLRAIHRLSEHMRKFYNVAMARRFAISQKKKSLSLRRQ